MDRRPRVTVIQSVGSPYGGIEQVLATVLPRLSDEFEIHFIDPYQNEEFSRRLGGGDVRVVRLAGKPSRSYVGGRGTLLRPLYMLQAIPWLLPFLAALRRWMRDSSPDLVYLNQLRVLRVFGRLADPRRHAMVYQLHGARSSEHIGAARGRFLNERFDRVMAVSRAMSRFLTGAGVRPDKIDVVYNSVDVDGLRARAEVPAEGLPPRIEGSVVFVHVGAITRHKKAQHLGIAALGRLADHPNAHLWICGDVPDGGDPSYLAELKQLTARNGLADRVHFLGWRKDVPSVVRQSDVAILPSIDHSESFGLVLAEAMALGKPCIGSTVGGIPEVIEDGTTGVVCDPDPTALSGAMRRLIESPELRGRMGRAGFDRVRELFGLERQVSRIAGVFRRVLHERAERGGSDRR